MDNEYRPEEFEWTLWDEKLKAGRLDPKKWKDKSIHKYRINVNHPEVKPIYRRYCYLVTGRAGYPISDTQRFEFENMVLAVMALYDKNKEEKIALLRRDIELIPKSPYWISVIPGRKHLEHERFKDRFLGFQ